MTTKLVTLGNIKKQYVSDRYKRFRGVFYLKGKRWWDNTMADASAPSRLLEQFKDGSLTLEAYQTEIQKLYEAKELDMMTLIQWVSKASEWKGSQKKPRAKTPKKEKDLFAEYQDNMKIFTEFLQTEEDKFLTIIFYPITLQETYFIWQIRF